MQPLLDQYFRRDHIDIPMSDASAFPAMSTRVAQFAFRRTRAQAFVH
jgi:hypothetical protein